MLRRAGRLTVSRSQGFEYALLIILALIALFRWVHLIQHICSYYVDLPTWDYWRVVENLAAYRAGNLKVFWRQHNEHRIIFPEMVFAADMLWFQGRKILPTVAELACYVGTLLIMAATLFREARMRTSIKLAAFLLASITLGWMGSAIVLGDPFLLQWTMLHLWVVSALLLLSVAKSRASWMPLAASLVCAGGATYTSGNGMLIWPVLLAAGMGLRFRKSEILSIGLAGCALVGLYFVGYRPVGSVKFLPLLANFAHSLGFVGSYLGMPFAANRSRSFGIEAGWLNITLFVFLLWMAARKGLLRARPAVVLFGVFAFTALSAVLAAAGRMDPGDRSFVLAKQARYVTTPLVNWAALIILCVWLGGKGRQTFWWSWRVPLVIGLALLLGFRHLSSWVQARDAEVADLQLGALGVQAGILDDAVLKKFFPAPAFVRLYLPELRAGRLSIYSEEETSWVGEPLSALSGTFLPARPAAMRYQIALPSGSEVGITVWNERGGDVPRCLVFANQADVIVGLGRVLRAGIPFAVQSNMKGGQAMFGFVNVKLPLSSLHVYLARDGDHALTPVERTGR